MSRAARVAAAVVAVLVLAWLGLSLRNVRLEERGGAAAGRLAAPGNAVRAQEDFRRVRLLNPDPQPDVARAVVLLQTGRPARAIALLEVVLRREPDNARVWRTLFEVTAERDSARAQRALAALRRLDPLNFERR